MAKDREDVQRGIGLFIFMIGRDYQLMQGWKKLLIEVNGVVLTGVSCSTYDELVMNIK